MDDIERRTKIIEFIRNNRECMPEDVVRAVARHMSRQKFFKMLQELKERGTIVARNRNKRDQALQLNGEDPLVIVGDTLKNFEYSYFDLFDKVLENIMKPSYTIKEQQRLIENRENRHVLFAPDPVSYTHLTLPTILRV